MGNLSRCRICLIKDVRMHCLVNTDLQEIYELLTGKLLETRDRRPVVACYVCCARFRNCLQLRSACLHSEELFSRLLDNHHPEVTSIPNTRKLQIVQLTHLSVEPEAHKGPAGDDVLRGAPLAQTGDVLVKEEPVEDSEEDLIQNQISCEFIKQEDIKCGDVCSEDDELEYHSTTVQCQANLSDCCGGSSVEDAVGRQSVAADNISSLHLYNIDMKTPLICSYDVCEGATVTERLTSDDLEDTSTSTGLNNQQHQLMLKNNSCERFKNTVQMCRSKKRGTLEDMYTHPPGAPYECDICGKSFINRNSFTCHIRTHCNKQHKCDICGKSFSKSYLQEHMLIHTGEKPHKCDKCGKGFRRKWYLIIHSRIHTGEKPYKCSTCEKSFNQSCTLLAHIRTHTGKKPYKCDVCGKKFSRSNNLSVHSRTHSGEKPYKCYICGKGFSHDTSLKPHIQKHFDKRPYSCSTCGRSFFRKGDLNGHIRIHTGEKRYICDTCGTGFNRKKALSTHIISTHTDEECCH